MAGSVNKAIIIGNLGSDPEVRYTANGQAVSNFSLATSESWVNKNGNKEERTEWHRIVVWGKLAELCKEYLSKGRQVYVEGRLQTRSWEDRDGNKRYTTEVVAGQVIFLSGRGKDEVMPAAEPYGSSGYSSGGSSGGGGGGGGGVKGARRSETEEMPQDQPPPGFDDDIPF